MKNADINRCIAGRRAVGSPGLLRKRESGHFAKIINNGVPESGFKLEIVPNDQADQAGGQVVGHCENDTQKIVYTRLNNGDDRGDAAQTGTSQDTSNAQ